MIKPYYQDDAVTIYHGDCREIVPELIESDSQEIVCITDPPYGMKKADWDMSIPCWLPLVGDIPVATFCGVVGMRDYPTPDWVGAWVRIGSTQRNGKLRGFNNWEPILFYNITRLANDVISVPNYHPDTGHPTTKPTKLFERLIGLMPEGIILDPFAGSGTTGRAAKDLGRKAILIEIEEKYCEIAAGRMRQEVLI